MLKRLVQELLSGATIKIMQIVIDKIISKNVYKTELIGTWYKPKGFDLSMTNIDCAPLKISVNLVYGKYDDFRRMILEQFGEDLKHDSCVAMCVTFKDKDQRHWNFVLIQENEWTAQHYGTICHELHHLVHFALSEKGVNYGEGGEEVYAYLQGYYMELVVRAFQELKRATAKKKK